MDICQPARVTERDERIIEAAIRLFTRYGVKRTGMNDIAGEAGISRQTLYKAFSNKNVVLQATIRLLTDRAITGIEEGLRHANGLDDELDIVFGHIAIAPFDLMHAAPNAEDIVAGFNASSQAELDAAAERNRTVLARILSSHSNAIEANGLTVEQLANFVQQSASAAKYGAQDRQHLQGLLNALKIATLKVAGVI